MKGSTENIAYCFNTLDNDSQYDMGFKFRGNFKAHKCINQILSFIGNNYCTYSEEDVLIGDCSAFSPFKKVSNMTIMNNQENCLFFVVVERLKKKLK